MAADQPPICEIRIRDAVLEFVEVLSNANPIPIVALPRIESSYVICDFTVPLPEHDLVDKYRVYVDPESGTLYYRESNSAIGRIQLFGPFDLAVVN